ncbi:helix-turn-helix domain-containing protein [Enterococcus sp. AZ194]|uniref:helix-turn-helix domain-containing protein n=1 Tax=Enterococcus sp. AZ194 TaxID=2774629 RepID=UPI003F687D08
MIEEFLEDDDRYIELIVSWLELKKDSYVYLGEIEEFLGLSRFKVKKYIDMLTIDLASVSQAAHIEITENGQVITKRFDNLLVKKLTLYLLKRSVKFRFYMDVLLEGMSFESFCSTNFISRSTMYEIRKELNMSLKKNNIRISNNQLKGMEEEIRNFTFSLLYGAFNGLESPFNETLSKEVNEILNRIVIAYDLSLSPSENNQLAVFLGVLCLRKNKKVTFSKKLVEVSADYEVTLIQTIFPTFYELWNEKRRVLEYVFLEVFLFSATESVLTPAKLQRLHILLDFDQYKEVAANFIAKLTPNGQSKIKMNLSPILYREIGKLMLKMLYFDIEFDSFYSQQQLLFFKECYPNVSKIVEKEVCLLKLRFRLTEDKEQRIYYDLMFLIIDLVPLEEIEADIYICVDFVQGRHYTGVISKQILGFKDLSLKIEHSISAKTQLYVSDSPISLHSIEQVIWKNPPTPIDWRDFGDKLIAIKGGRQNA